MLQDPRWNLIVITREEKTAILLVLHRYNSTGVPVNDEKWSNGDLTARLVLVRKWEESAGRDDEGGGGVA